MESCEMGYTVFVEYQVHGYYVQVVRWAYCVAGFVDSDYAGDIDKRVYFGLCVYFDKWTAFVEIYITSNEHLVYYRGGYMALTEVSKEVVWLKGLVSELSLKQDGILFRCDSQSAFYLAKNQVYHARTKHAH